MAEPDARTSRLVIVGIDGSPQCEHAFNFYADTLHKKDNEILLIHCADPPYVHSSQGVYISGDVWQQMLDREKANIKQLEEKFNDLMKTKGICGKIQSLFTTKPGEVIVQTATEEKALMVVMGTRGLGTIRRTILGSVSDFVVHHAHCPVIVCRQ